MVAVISLPKTLTKKGELVLIARSEYEKLLRLAKEKVSVDEGLQIALTEVREGKLIGPLKNSRELMRSLASL